jgi:hypothetical protein
MATLFTFEEIGPNYSGSGIPVDQADQEVGAEAYRAFSWNGIWVYGYDLLIDHHWAGSGYLRPATLASADSSLFTLKSGYFKTGPSEPSGLLIITAYNSGVQKYSMSLAEHTPLSLITFNWVGIDRLEFSASDWSMDNLEINAAVVPEASTWLAGILAFLPMLGMFFFRFCEQNQNGTRK